LAIDLVRHGLDQDFSLMPSLFPRAVRPHVRALGRFVRLADGVADDAFTAAETRLGRLTLLERALREEIDPDWSEEARAIVRDMRASLRATGVSAAHPRHMVEAFRRDLATGATATWNDLMVYCQFAAAPIGRFLLELVGEDIDRCGRSSDALCAALRILRQLRDCEDPAAQFARLCIPEGFLEDAMITRQHLRAPQAKGQIRAVIDRVLDGVENLLEDARPLPGLVRSRGLRVHIHIVLCRAHKLVGRFRARDPLQERVGLGTGTRRLCLWLGWVRGLVRLPFVAV
jgi:phytoene/squalene synthetase